MKSPVRATESQEQRTLIEWWASYCRTIKQDERLLMSIPNGSVLAGDAKQRAIQMARLKREGLRLGAPDLLLAIPVWSKYKAGLFIEMKRIGEKARSEQVTFHDMLRDHGYRVVVCQGFDQAKAAIVEYLN